MSKAHRLLNSRLESIQEGGEGAGHGPSVRATLLQATGPSVQELLAYKKTHPPRTLPYASAWGPKGILGGWAFSYV